MTDFAAALGRARAAAAKTRGSTGSSAKDSNKINGLDMVPSGTPWESEGVPGVPSEAAPQVWNPWNPCGNTTGSTNEGREPINKQSLTQSGTRGTPDYSVAPDFSGMAKAIRPNQGHQAKRIQRREMACGRRRLPLGWRTNLFHLPWHGERSHLRAARRQAARAGALFSLPPSLSPRPFQPERGRMGPGAAAREQD